MLFVQYSSLIYWDSTNTMLHESLVRAGNILKHSPIIKYDYLFVYCLSIYLCYGVLSCSYSIKAWLAMIFRLLNTFWLDAICVCIWTKYKSQKLSKHARTHIPLHIYDIFILLNIKYQFSYPWVKKVMVDGASARMTIIWRCLVSDLNE